MYLILNLSTTPHKLEENFQLTAYPLLVFHLHFLEQNGRRFLFKGNFYSYRRVFHTLTWTAKVGHWNLNPSVTVYTSGQCSKVSVTLQQRKNLQFFILK